MRSSASDDDFLDRRVAGWTRFSVPAVNAELP